jgi:hypothetical protein
MQAKNKALLNLFCSYYFVGLMFDILKYVIEQNFLNIPSMNLLKLKKKFFF